MKDKFTKRDVLSVGIGVAAGFMGLRVLSEPTVAVAGWSASDVSFSNSSGDLSSIQVPESGFEFTFTWSGLGSGTHTVETLVEMKLDDGNASSAANTYEDVWSGEFSVEDGSGSEGYSKLNWDSSNTDSFPIDITGSHSGISLTDFEPSSDGETKSTTVDFRITFNTEGISRSATVSFDASVSDTALPSAAFANGDFETGDLSGWDSDAQSGVNTTAYNSSYAFFGSGRESSDEWASQDIAASGKQPSKITFYFRETSNSSGHGVRFKNSNGNYEVGAGTDNPAWTYSAGSNSLTTLNSSVSGYKVWVKTEIEFDWGNSEMRITFTKQEGSGMTDSTGWIAMGNGTDIKTVEIWPQHYFVWGFGIKKQGWVDEISITY
jgi:hypothetical protein